MKGLLFSFLFTWILTGLQGQTHLQVAVKATQEVIKADKINRLNLTAESADIEITGWDKPDIRFQVQLTAKNTSKETAAADLEKMKLITQKIGSSYFLRNYLSLKKHEQKPTSSFRAKYTIFVPRQMMLEISDTFGEIRIQEIQTSLKLNTRFCKTSVSGFPGTLELDAFYGEVQLQGKMQKATIRGDHARITVDTPSPNLQADLNAGYFYGEPAINGYQNFRVANRNGEVRLHLKNPESFGLNVEAVHSELKLPDKIRPLTPNKSFIFNPDKPSRINISISYGILTIQ